jgi:hypothetical protein
MIECKHCKKMMTDFYSSFNNNGGWDLYCYECYSKNVLDNFGNMIAPEPTKTRVKCECGTKAPIGQNHGRWCDFYKSEF